MVIKVKGIRNARWAAGVMEETTGIETHWYRGEDTGGIYWVSNTHLEPRGEQIILEGLAADSLLYVSGCSHQMKQRPNAVKQSRETSGRRKIDDQTRQSLLRAALRIGKDEYGYGEQDIDRENTGMCCALSPHRFRRKKCFTGEKE